MEKLTKNIFHHFSFADVGRLVDIKEKKNLKISLAFPTLNEEATIGSEIDIIRRDLVEQYPLVDEIAVIDSGSADNTAGAARAAGAEFHLASEILPQCGPGMGKGENLWKSLHVLKGDIIVWLDADIENIHPKFVYGLVGPLLEHDRIMFTKAFYDRPLTVGGDLMSSGGGRVTEILVRPLFACFYPELSWVFQPCAGEYAGRRELLETLSFPMGYGVETGMLVDIYSRFGLDVIAQVNLDKRIHRNRPIEALSRMGFEIAHTFMNRLLAGGKAERVDEICDAFLRARLGPNGLVLHKEEVQIGERPPINNNPDYLAKWPRENSSSSDTDRHTTTASA